MKRRQWASTLVIFMFLAGCGGSESQVSLATLADYQDGYDGRDVVTEGTVRTFDEPRHYWIEDEDLNRVAIEPESSVADRVGERVRIQGRFTASREAGRLIEAEAVSPLEHD